MSRMEFSTKTKRQALERCKGHCEGCGASLWQKARIFDHRIPCALGGTNDLENCNVLCTTCDDVKTDKKDIPVIAKAKRNWDKHNGIRKRSSFACSRDSKWKKKLSGEVVAR